MAGEFSQAQRPRAFGKVGGANFSMRISSVDKAGNRDIEAYSPLGFTRNAMDQRMK